MVNKTIIKHFLTFVLLSLASLGSSTAQNNFWLAPYSAKRNNAGNSGSISESIRDGFNVGGLSYASGSNYTTEIIQFNDLNISLVKRLFPVRTVTDTGSPKYHCEVGT